MSTPRESTARAFAWFQAAYPSARKTDQSTVELWTEALTYESSSAIEAAARAWIRAEPRYPSLAGFLELVRGRLARDRRRGPRHGDALPERLSAPTDG